MQTWVQAVLPPRRTTWEPPPSLNSNFPTALP
jgi:hypothetical protein